MKLLIVVTLIVPMVDCVVAQADNPVTHNVELEYDASDHSLLPSESAETPVTTNGDEVSIKLGPTPSFPVVVRRVAYAFNYKTKHEKRRGGIAGFFGGKTTVITDHPTWVIVDIEAKTLGEDGEIAITAKIENEEAFLPTLADSSHKVAQVMGGGGPIVVTGAVTADADGFEQANQKLLRQYVDPSGGYGQECLNRENAEIVEAGEPSRELPAAVKGFSLKKTTLSGPPQLKFVINISVTSPE